MTDPDDTPEPEPPSGKHCRTCPSPLPPRTGRYIGLCPGCIGETRARVVAAMAADGRCLHDRDPARCRQCARDATRAARLAATAARRAAYDAARREATRERTRAWHARRRAISAA